MAESFQAEIKKYTEALAADPNSRVFVPLSDLYRKLGRYDEAILVAREGLARHPHYLGGKVALARALFENGDLETAEPFLEEVLNFAPDNLLANRLLAQVCLQTNRRDRAVPLLKRIREMDPADAWVAKELARVADVPAPAPAAVPPPPPPAAAKAEPEPLETATLAGLYRSQGHVDRALQIYRNLLRHDPNNASLLRTVREMEGKPEAPTKPGRREILDRLLARIAERRRQAA